jgi:hypothetical protein
MIGRALDVVGGGCCGGSTVTPIPTVERRPSQANAAHPPEVMPRPGVNGEDRTSDDTTEELQK